MIVRAGDDLSWWSFLVVGREEKKGFRGILSCSYSGLFSANAFGSIGKSARATRGRCVASPATWVTRNSFLLGAVPFFEFVLGVLGRPPGAVQMRRQYRSGVKKPRIFHRLSLFCMVGKFVVNCHCSSPSVQCGKNPYSEAAAQTKKLQTFASSNCSYPNPP